MMVHAVSHNDRASRAPALDGEAAWLLSRAALQLDQTKIADAMLALVGDFGKRNQLSPEPAPYVGSKRCGDCHGKIYHQQQEESRHALTLRFGTALKDVPLPRNPVPDPVSPGITHAFARRGDDRIEVESRAGGEVVRAIVEYAVGSGRHGITMVARDLHGVDRELRVSYFAEKESWGETKGIDFPRATRMTASASRFLPAASIAAFRVIRRGFPRSATDDPASSGLKVLTGESAANDAMGRGSTTSSRHFLASPTRRSPWARNLHHPCA